MIGLVKGCDHSVRPSLSIHSIYIYSICRVCGHCQLAQWRSVRPMWAFHPCDCD